MTRSVRVRAVGTAVAPHRLRQVDAREFARRFFADDFPAIDRLLPAFDHTGISSRYMACPLDWYGEPHGFAEKNEIYCRVARELSLLAAGRALEASGVEPGDLGALVLVSTTGLATPSLDSFLIQDLDLPRDIARLPIWGLGCAGGAAGLARSADLVRGLEKPALLVSVEVCSTTFVHGDRSKSNLIATALFGDGAAAVLLAPGDEGLEVLGGHSRLLDDTEHIMGWDLASEGLQVRFSSSIPDLVEKIIPDFLDQCEAEAGLEEGFDHFVLHPGGAKVLEAYERILDTSEDALSDAHEVLREFGNMSSPTVLFVLERFLRQTRSTGAYGLMLGLGPGFSAEGVSFRW